MAPRTATATAAPRAQDLADPVPPKRGKGEGGSEGGEEKGDAMLAREDAAGEGGEDLAGKVVTEREKGKGKMARVSRGGVTDAAPPRFIAVRGEWEASDRDQTVHDWSKLEILGSNGLI